jgi:hypothetical protein
MNGEDEGKPYRAAYQTFPETWRAFMISFVHLVAETESSAPLVP